MTMLNAAIAVRRFGYGARFGEIEAIAKDPRNWLKAQLAPEKELPAALQNVPNVGESMGMFARALARVQQRVARGEAPPAANADPNMPNQDAAEQSIREAIRPLATRAYSARVAQSIGTDRPFYERIVHFWSNHFAVSAQKAQVNAGVAAFEKDVARPHAVGRFETLLVASSQHPAMLAYLDNISNIGPNSPAAARLRAVAERRPRAPTGLNENLAREILELHTLGVNGGYGQADVTNFAKVLTGWGINRRAAQEAGRDGSIAALSARDLFQFTPFAHEPGAHVVLGRAYADQGERQGLEVLETLARHPSTAKFIALKIAKHFVADEPPSSLVVKLETAFKRHDGDMAKVFGALIDADEAWDPQPQKYLRPEEFMFATLRGLNIHDFPVERLAFSVEAMGQRPFSPPGPDGFADNADFWLSPDFVWRRAEWAMLIARNVANVAKDMQPNRVGQALLGPLLTAPTAEAISRAESPAQGLALLLASADFQRR